MPVPVACKGDVSAYPGFIPYPPAVGGDWIPGPVEYPGEYPKLTISKTPVIYKATCKFSFVGVDETGAVVNGSSTVTLQASRKSLQSGSNFVLVNGEMEQDGYENTLVVQCPSNKLASS